MNNRWTTLVDTATAAAHLDDPDWIFVDCRFTLTNPAAGLAAWTHAHIPGARYAHLDNDLSAPRRPDTGRHPLPPPGSLAEKLGAWGVDSRKQVVVYDDSFGAMAGRLWWLLKWLGHDAVALLDGGLPKWRREGLPLDANTPAPVATRFEARPDPLRCIDAAGVAAALASGDHVLLDARAEERFRGEIEPLDAIAGHIPGSRNYPYEENLDLGGTFLPVDELREQLATHLGATPPQRVIHLCGSGVTACHNLIAMEAAGLTGSRLYAGSWSDWITDPTRAIATGEA